MKNLKSILIYGVIVLLCISAFIGYFISNNASKTSTPSNQVANQNTETSKVSNTESTKTSKVPEEVKQKAAYITDGNNIKGIS